MPDLWLELIGTIAVLLAFCWFVSHALDVIDEHRRHR